MKEVANLQVAILGAAGGIGQPLAMLMKVNPLVGNLALYDVQVCAISRRKYT